MENHRKLEENCIEMTKNRFEMTEIGGKWRKLVEICIKMTENWLEMTEIGGKWWK